MHADFQQPVFLTLCHMMASSLVSAALVIYRRKPQPAISRRHLMGVLALAAVFSSSVLMGNMALRFVHVSFFQVQFVAALRARWNATYPLSLHAPHSSSLMLPQAVSATTPAFVAALALALLKQRERWAVYAALIPVMAGLVIATGAEPALHIVGFAATIGATVLRALKTVIQVDSAFE